MGFKIKIVLADSEYGESDSNFVSILNQEKINFVLASYKYPVTTVVTVNSCYIFYCINYIYNVNLVDKCRKVKENIR